MGKVESKTVRGVPMLVQRPTYNAGPTPPSSNHLVLARSFFHHRHGTWQTASSQTVATRMSYKDRYGMSSKRES